MGGGGGDFFRMEGGEGVVLLLVVLVLGLVLFFLLFTLEFPIEVFFLPDGRLLVLLPLATLSLDGARRGELTVSVGDSSGVELGFRVTVTLETVMPTASHLRVVYFFVSLTSLLGEAGLFTRTDQPRESQPDGRGSLSQFFPSEEIRRSHLSHLSLGARLSHLARPRISCEL